MQSILLFFEDKKYESFIRDTTHSLLLFLAQQVCPCMAGKTKKSRGSSFIKVLTYPLQIWLIQFIILFFKVPQQVVMLSHHLLFDSFGTVLDVQETIQLSNGFPVFVNDLLNTSHWGICFAVSRMFTIVLSNHELQLEEWKNELCHTWMSHATHMNESCHTSHEYV